MVFLSVAVSFYFAGDCLAKSPADYMNEGNAAYRAGNWQLAIDFYAGARISNADLFYNRANAHFKNGELGMAVLYYNRALRIKPRDEDIITNLEIARQKIIDRIEPPKSSRIFELARSLLYSLSVNEHAFIMMLLFTLLVLSAGVLMTLAPGRNRAAAVNVFAAVAVLFTVQTVITVTLTLVQNNTRMAVVVAKKVDGLSSPYPGSDKLFELHEGMEIRVLREENGFQEATLPTGWTGWVRSDAVEEIREYSRQS